MFFERLIIIHQNEEEEEEVEGVLLLYKIDDKRGDDLTYQNLWNFQDEKFLITFLEEKKKYVSCNRLSAKLEKLYKDKRKLKEKLFLIYFYKRKKLFYIFSRRKFI